MKRKFKVNPRARIVYIPRDLIEEGLSGEVDGYVSAVTVTLVNPKANLDEVIRSLKLVLDDIELRKQIQERETNSEKSG